MFAPQEELQSHSKTALEGQKRSKSRAGYCLCRVSEAGPVGVQMPGGLTGAVIFGAAFVAAVGQVAVKLGAEAVQHLCKSAASTLVMAH